MTGIITALIVFGSISLTVIAPLWIIMHYASRWRAQKTLSTAEAKAMSDLAHTLARMEERIASLEIILNDHPADGRGR